MQQDQRMHKAGTRRRGGQALVALTMFFLFCAGAHAGVSPVMRYQAYATIFHPYVYGTNPAALCNTIGKDDVTAVNQAWPNNGNSACPLTHSWVGCGNAKTTAIDNGQLEYSCDLDYYTASPIECGGDSIGPAGYCYAFNHYYCPPEYSQISDTQCGIADLAVPDPDKNKGNCPICEGNPINPLVGNKHQTELDYRNGGAFPLVLKRVYNSFGVAPGLFAFSDCSGADCSNWTEFIPGTGGGGVYIPLMNIGSYTSCPIDFGWRLSYDRALSAVSGPVNIATLFRPDSKTRTFTFTGGIWIPDAGELDTHLTQQVDNNGSTLGWSYVNENDETEKYGPDGKLLSITNRDGLVQTLQYDSTAGLLASVTDAFGRKLTFSHDPTSGQLIGATDPSGGSYTYAYTTDGNDNLASVKYPDTRTRQYLYEDPTSKHALTGLVDESGNRYATWTYDATGAATGSQHAGGVEGVTISYPSVHTSIATDAGGATRTYSIQVVNGIAKAGTVVETCGANCSRTSATTYDADGNITIDDDVNGNRTCLAYDPSRDLPTTILEGLPNTKACPATLAPHAVDAAHPERLTTTTWHPDLVLKAREATPKKLTTWVYNGQSDPIAGGTANCAPMAPALPNGKPIAVLCARYEQATTDTTGALGLSATATGATQKWSYTYNQFGQVLTETSPKQSATDTLSHTTTYAYYTATSFSGGVGHTTGDLQTVTNPLGQVTSYTSYDKSGRLLSSKAANGTVTTQTYLPRGWLHTLTITPAAGGGVALTTTFDYLPTGLLKTVTLPDANTLNYTYDAAHRLTDVIDAAGNKVHYVLDLMDNRTSEQVSDASGALVSTVARVFDTLNRLRAVTGVVH